MGIINKKNKKPWPPSTGLPCGWGCRSLLMEGNLGSKNPEKETLPRPHRALSHFPRAAGSTSCRTAPAPPPSQLRQATLSCFIRSVQFLRQNKPSNSHAVQVKLKVRRCGESCLLDGNRDNMSMYKVPPASSAAPGDTTWLRLCVPSFHKKNLGFCAEGRFTKAQVSVTLGHTPLSDGRAGLEGRNAGPCAPSPRRSSPA